jgi:predicted transcriptional regulator
MPRRNGTGIDLLADPTRRRIIALIAVRPRRPGAIARELSVDPSTVTHQLRLLQRAGLVLSRSVPYDGRGRSYLLAPRSIGPVVAWLSGTEIARPEEPVGRLDARPERVGGSRTTR